MLGQPLWSPLSPADLMPTLQRLSVILCARVAAQPSLLRDPRMRTCPCLCALGRMGWDASRVSAAVPSGVGFLGAASIWKGTKGTGDNQIPEVHGLTTATSIWMAAAVGILCGGGLFVLGLFTTSIGKDRAPNPF